MTFLETLRKRQASTARTITVLFSLAWLCLALQPCSAMDDPGASGHSGMAGHHAAQEQGGHDCPHCPPAPEGAGDAPCGSALSCESVGTPTVPSKVMDAPQPDLVAIMPLVDLPAANDVSLASVLRPPTHAPQRTPTASLQQRYCSYLK